MWRGKRQYFRQLFLVALLENACISQNVVVYFRVSAEMRAVSVNISAHKKEGFIERVDIASFHQSPRACVRAAVTHHGMRSCLLATAEGV